MKLLGQVYNKVAYGRCYIIGPLNALQLLTGKQVTYGEYGVFLSDMKSKGHNPKYGKIFGAGISDVLSWRKIYKLDTIEVSEIKLFSFMFRVNVFRKIPMCVSINVGDQFRADREDGVLDDTVFDDVKKTGHTTVIHGRQIKDSRRDQKTYSFTRKYFETVGGLFKSQKVLVFKKV